MGDAGFPTLMTRIGGTPVSAPDLLVVPHPALKSRTP